MNLEILLNNLITVSFFALIILKLQKKHMNKSYIITIALVIIIVLANTGLFILDLMSGINYINHLLPTLLGICAVALALYIDKNI